MRTRLKVCCISSLDEARLAMALGADALGLVGAMPSGPGVVDNATIRAIAAVVPPPVATFLLTSETQAEAIARHAEATGANTVQIVRHVEPSIYARLRARLPARKLVQVIHVEGPEALTLAADYAGVADALLLDSGRPGAAVAELGGTGRTHDWSLSRRIVETVTVPVFLAGGLQPGNVAQAVRAVRPFGVDLCSGVRTDGRLDATKLAAFRAALAAA